MVFSSIIPMIIKKTHRDQNRGLSKRTDLQYYLRLSEDYVRLPLGLSEIISIISYVLWDDLGNTWMVRYLSPNITVQFEINLGLKINTRNIRSILV